MNEPVARRLGVGTATLLVIASMIGTGVYTTTGFLVRDVQSLPAVLAAWGVGAVAALSGALCYGELAAALPVSGGEYALLRRIYHPLVGFLAGWVSFLVGFSAPAAAAAIAFGKYAAAMVPAISPMFAATGLLLVVSGIHAADIRLSSGFQNLFTLIKVLLAAGFAAVGLALVDLSRIFEAPGPPVGEAMLSPGFAVGVVYVFYAYTGWNAAAYVAGEVKRPQRTLPLALTLGTGIVAALYLAVNMVFLASAPREQLAGVVEVGHVAATAILGDGAGILVSLLICVGLVSTLGALMLAGPRVYEAMGRDYPRLEVLARRRAHRGPAVAVGLQAAAALAMTLTASFDALLAYIGVTLSLFSALTVAGVFVLRRRRPDLDRPYRTFGYPLTPLVFLAVTLWVAAYTLWERPTTALAAIATLAGGGLLYGWARRINGG